MNKIALLPSVAVVVILAVGAGPAHAQFGALNDALNKAAKVKKIADLKVTDAEERQIGQEVSDKMVETFGVYQDVNVTKYVTLVGAVLAQNSSRPGLNWQFVVLDTDGVNAFAAPGGFVHITRGLLGLIKDEAELAGVLGHELIHVTEKHTVNAIQKGGTFQLAADEVSASGGMTQELVARLAQAAYSDVLNNKFSRNDENEADEKGVQLANKVGYAPMGLTSVLTKLVERNKDAKEPNGLFASHPVIKDRITNIEKTIREKKLTATATVQPRYAKNITFDVKPVTAIATVPEGSRGLAGGEEKKPADSNDASKKEEPKKEEPKKSGGMLSRLRPGGGSQAQQSQTVASAGARGVNPDRDAVGGPNKNRVSVKITPGDIAEFQKGIA
jgi:beta-barrel assembly-enhancing protease